MDLKKKSQTMDMTKGSPTSLLLRFAMPLFLGNLLQQFYNLVDTSIAGNLLGDGALAQIGATAALYSLITNFAFGMNNGLALGVSRNFGAGDQQGVKKSVCWMTCLSCFCSVVLTVAFLIFRKGLLQVMQIPDDVMDGALRYLTIILAGIPLTMLYNLEASLLQAVGNSVMPLVFLLFSSVLNVGLDFWFMGPLGLGVQGAASATVLAQGISAGIGLGYIVRYYPELRFSKNEFKVKKNFVIEMFFSGLSMGMMNAIYCIGSVILQSSINALGSVYIVAQVGGRRLAELFYIPGLALGTSTAIYASQNYGAGLGKRIRRGCRTAILLYGIWWIIALMFTFTLAPAAIRLLTGSSNPEVISNGLLYLRISIPMIPPMAVLVILRNALQGMQHLKAPLICSTLELIGKVIFAIWLAPVWGYIAVCICEPVTWVICCAFIVGSAVVFRKEFQTAE